MWEEVSMPWMKPNVREQREQFVIRAKNKNESFRSVCESFGISRTTGYHWVNRYTRLGNLRDLSEQSRRPHNIANKTGTDIENKVLELRDQSGRGARRIAAALRQQNIRLAPTTIN